LCRIVTAFRH